MTIFTTLGTLLATIPGMTLGVNVITPENPRLDAQEAQPSIKIQRISNMGEFTLAGARFWTQDRIQVTMSASTLAGLFVLNGQVSAKLDHTTVAGITRSIPWQSLYREGHEDSPEIFWNMSDWLIMY